MKDITQITVWNSYLIAIVNQSNLDGAREIDLLFLKSAGD